MDLAAGVASTPLDLRYLLFLQDFRIRINDALTPMMETISLFAVTCLIMIPVLVYWMLDKKSGLYTLVSYYVCCGVNAVVKLTVCAYRPWIRDPRIVPAGDAIRTAGGYSFPSGHTVTAGPIYGGLGVSVRKRMKWVSAVCVLMVLLTGFSRNYLGVHTPQDVFVGICESVLWLILVARAFRYLERHPEREDRFLLGCFVFGWLAILFVTFKPYPMTYVDGELLVDPKKMMVSGYGDIALLIAFPAARYVERRWVRFRSTGVNARGLVLCAVGMVGLWAMLTYLKAPLDNLLGRCWGHFVYTCAVVFYSVALYPWVIRLFSGKETPSAQE